MNTQHKRLRPLPLLASAAGQPVDPLQQGLALFHAMPPDYARAAGWFRAAADAENADALAMLGLCQLEGLGMPADATQARALFQRAAGMGSAIGQFQLGRVLMTGRGGPANEGDGLSAYVVAAAMGHAEAMFNLANCLYAGVGCLPDRLAAKALYLRSRSLGCTLRPRGIRVQRRDLKAVRTLALRLADPSRLIFLLKERQQEIALVTDVARACARPRQSRSNAARHRPWRRAGWLAAGVMAAMADTLGQYLRRRSSDAGPTKIDF